MTEAALDSRVRRAAKRVGLVAKKSRWRAGTIDNHGDYCLVDPFRNWVVRGERFDLSAEEVISYCEAAS